MQLFPLGPDGLQGSFFGGMAAKVVADLVRLNTGHPELGGLVKTDALLRPGLIPHVLAMGHLTQVAEPVVKAVPIAVVNPADRVNAVMQLPSDAMLSKRTDLAEGDGPIARSVISGTVTSLDSVAVPNFPRKNASLRAVTQLFSQKLQWWEGF